ncbi:MAG: class I SAM-dependent methyltransferase [Caldisphaeraceae archaeon]|nr:class I SAM-dependent methyltransferase [Caldisphaeraceae archaeon]
MIVMMDMKKAGLGLDEEFWKDLVNEIERYSQRGCYEKANNIMSFYTLKKLRIIASSLAVGSKVIVDAGSGPGTSTWYIKQVNSDSLIVALDPSFAMLEAAKDSMENLNLVNGMFECIPMKENSADSIIAMFSFRDARFYEDAIKEFSRILRPDGKLIILDLYKPENTLEKIMALFQFNIFSIISGLLAGCGLDSFNFNYLYRTLNKMLTPKELLVVTKKYFRNAVFKKLPILVGILYAMNPL